MTYNLSSISTEGGLLPFTQGVNTILVEGQLGLLLLIGIGIILLSGFYWSTRDMKMSFTATMFIIFIMSILLRAASLINTTVIFVTLVGLAISIAVAWKN